MCGIAGATSNSDQASLADAVKRLSHRGPDDQRLWRDPQNACALACARLATTDLSSDGAQPMVSGDERFVLAFNGYIAGHRRMLAVLKEQRISPRGQSDAELVLHILTQAIIRSASVTNALSSLSGQYALALWDCDQASLYLARDPLGIKPLYVMNRPDGHLAFASEIPALSAFGPLRHDENVRSEYFAHLFVPSPASGSVDVTLVPAGRVLCWQGGQVTNSQIPHPAKGTVRPKGRPQNQTDETHQIETLRAAVWQSVGDAMDADCSVGTLVSGGLDSAGVAAMASAIARERGQPPPVGFVMGFSNPSLDETEAARHLARHLGQELHFIPAPEKPHEIFDGLQNASQSIGAPFANPSVVLMRSLSHAVGGHVKVCLSGDGGDELFGGYPRYRAARLFEQYWRHLPVPIRRCAAQIFGKNSARNTARFVAGGQGNARQAFEAWNNRCAIAELHSGLIDWNIERDEPLADAMMVFDRDVTLVGNQLMMSDRMGMLFGLEYRLPLLGHEVVRVAAGMSAVQHVRNGGKDIWRKAISPYLPKDHIGRPKIGFNPPTHDWLAKVCAYVWGDAPTITHALFEGFDVPKDKQGAYWKRAISGRAPDIALMLWALMVWQIWQHDGLGKPPRV